MDILITLLFMAIFYLGPALLKRYRAKNDIQPVIPELLNTEIVNEPPKNKKISSYMASVSELESTIAVDHVQSVATVVGEESPWHGKLDHNILANGVIFAEILQPPRAYRPFGRR